MKECFRRSPQQEKGGTGKATQPPTTDPNSPNPTQEEAFRYDQRSCWPFISTKNSIAAPAPIKPIYLRLYPHSLQLSRLGTKLFIFYLVNS